MKAGTHKITIEAQLTLSKRELELLNHISTYNHDAIARAVASSGYIGGVTEKEVTEFFQNIRKETDSLKSTIEDAKTKLFEV